MPTNMLVLKLLLAFALPLVSALKFDIQAHPGGESAKQERCIRNFVAKDQLVVVTATVSGKRGDGQTLNMHIKDAVGNDYAHPRDVAGENRFAFTSHADSAFDVCFENILTAQQAVMSPTRSVELDIDIGADAKDWSAIQAGEKLKPMEAELRRLSESAKEVVDEMDYLRTREMKLRDTNESTNERVKWFAIGTMGMLVALGIWQVVYLRAYFRIHYYATADPDACDQACDVAWKAFSGNVLDTGRSGWKRASANTRRDIIIRTADLFEERKEELIKAQMDETSCQRGWAMINVQLTVGYLREIASCVSHIKGQIPTIDKPDTFAFVFKEPVGPVLVIPPWNAALVLATRAITSALGAGCSVVLKASELSPLTHSLIVDIYHQAGLPPGVLNSLQTSRDNAAEITEHLIANPSIRKIEFIGSAAVGRIIGATAAKYLKPVLMELGGKGPAIVLDDANLQKAAVLCAKGATIHHGQICFSTERIIVLESVAKQFQELLVKAMEKEQGGQAVHSGIAEKARDILQQAKDNGNEFLIGGPEMAVKNGVRPSIVVVDPKTPKDQLRIVDEETFGPSASLYVVDSDIEAIRLANSSAYGLNATIHSTNMERALKMGKELDSAKVHINCISVYTSVTGPQGGVKGSGWGRQNADWGLEEFVQEKFITYHGADADVPAAK
ncbi:hypothetical protein LTS09_017475 [Friedmanniomyces endolithicus]|nr:hypothetical protein LTS09_017475 [Friedmanniomyces endolithicus]